jgi:hypothetical protein
MTVAATLGGWTATGSPALVISGSTQAISGPVVTGNAAFDVVGSFARVDSTAVVTQLNEFAGYLTGLAQTAEVDATIPFTGKSLSDLTDPGAALRAVVLNAIAPQTAPVFTSAQSLDALLKTTLGNGSGPGGSRVTFDAPSCALKIEFDLTHALPAVVADLIPDVDARSGVGYGVLRHIDLANAGSALNVTPTVDLSFDLKFDLGSTSTQTPPAAPALTVAEAWSVYRGDASTLDLDVDRVASADRGRLIRNRRRREPAGSVGIGLGARVR